MAATVRHSIVVVDDREEMRELLRTLLEYDDRFRVVGEAADGLEAIDVVARVRPDVVLLDHQMPRLTGIDALGRLRSSSPESKIMVLSNDPMVGREALARGADAFRDKATSFDEIAGVLIGLVSAPA
ncbi:MAG: response regulator transcription factor [Mycobacteriales bacterium]|nr:response regulator transcription factor [Frankia sp.]